MRVDQSLPRRRRPSPPRAAWGVALAAAAWLGGLATGWTQEAPASEAGGEAEVEDGASATEGLDLPALVGEGYGRLDAGDVAGAEEAFQAVLEVAPENLDAREGMVWVLVRRGLPERAAAAADVRLALDPTWREQWLTVISLAPSRQDEAAAAYRAQLELEPTALAPRLRLAALLAASPDRRVEAVTVYREALALAPDSSEAALGLAQVLAWEGQREEANALLDALLAAEPDNLDALLARARSARWGGDWDAARALYERGMAAAPGEGRFASERVQLELDPALQASEVAVAEALEARRARDVATMTEVGVFPTYSEDSAGFSRLALRLQGDVFPIESLRLRLRAGWTRFADDDDELDRLTFGGEARQSLPRSFYVQALYYAHLYRGAPNAGEWGAEVGADNPAWPVAFRVGGTEHALVDPLPQGEVLAPLDGVGSSGLTVASLREDVRIRDVYLAASSAGLDGAYLYATGAFGWVNDQNRRVTLGGGLGVDLVFFAAGSSAHELYAKYDYYFLAYRGERAEYWSPESFHSHTPGLAWRWRAGEAWIVGAEAGAPIHPANGSVGYLAGAFFRFAPSEHVYVQARGRAVDDTEFAMLAATLGVAVRF